MKTLLIGMALFVGVGAIGADLSILSGKYKCTSQRSATAPAVVMSLQLDAAKHFVWVQGQDIGIISGFATITDMVDLNKTAKIELFHPENTFAVEAAFSWSTAATVRLKFAQRYGVLACEKL